MLLPSPACLTLPPDLSFDLAVNVEPITAFFNEVSRLQEAVSNSLDQQTADTKNTSVILRKWCKFQSSLARTNDLRAFQLAVLVPHCHGEHVALHCLAQICLEWIWLGEIMGHICAAQS